MHEFVHPYFYDSSWSWTICPMLWRLLDSGCLRVESGVSRAKSFTWAHQIGSPYLEEKSELWGLGALLWIRQPAWALFPFPCGYYNSGWQKGVWVIPRQHSLHGVWHPCGLFTNRLGSPESVDEWQFWLALAPSCLHQGYSDRDKDTGGHL